MSTLTFSEENFAHITLNSGISRSSLVSFLKSEKIQKIHVLFKKYTFIQACEILKRAHSIAYRKEYRQGSTLQVEDVLPKVKALRLNYRVTNR